MKKIRIDFCDFGNNIKKTDWYLPKILAERFELEFCDHPDFLVYSCDGDSHRLYSGVRIFFSGESDMPDYRVCDYSVGCVKLDDPRHLELPFYVIFGTADQLIKKNDEHQQILAAKSKFCSFVVSGYNPHKNGNRVEFFKKLSKYKKVDSAGRKFNNVGFNIPVLPGKKVEFLRPYKFNICYENRQLAGYTTEKIIEPMVVRCLPIYWGDPAINDHFNPRSFLNRADFPSDEALIEKIIELDNDDEKYLEYMRQPYFHGDTPNQFFSHERILDYFEKIFSRKITPVAQAGRKSFSSKMFGRWQLVKRHHWHRMEVDGW